MEDTILAEIKNEMEYQLANIKVSAIVRLSKLIETKKNNKNNIFLCGVGKSGNLAKHCSDLLKSIAFPTFYLDVLNLTHGDIGILQKNDLVILFSNSGNTKELVELIPLLNVRKAEIVGICCNKNTSKFSTLCDSVFYSPLQSEISGKIDKIPTNSCMSQLLFTNILVSILKQNVNICTYTNNHTAGSIGKQLLQIKDVIKYDNFAKLVMVKGTSIPLHDVYQEMIEHKSNCCFFVDNADYLLGILTDGDIKRLILSKQVNEIFIEDLNRNYHSETNLSKYIKDCEKVSQIPIITNGGKLIGIVALIESLFNY